MNKKIKTAVIVILVLIIVFVPSFVLFSYYNPVIRISVSRGFGNSGEDDVWVEHIMVMTSTAFNLPLPKKTDSQLKEIWQWNDAAVVEFNENFGEGPRKITVSGEMKDEKTVLRYEGYYTNKNGEKVDYLNEKTFDFEISSVDTFLE